MEQVCFIISSVLNALSELLILKLDKNLIERVLEFYRFSLDVRGMCEKAELVCQTDQLRPFHFKFWSGLFQINNNQFLTQLPYWNTDKIQTRQTTTHFFFSPPTNHHHISIGRTFSSLHISTIIIIIFQSITRMFVFIANDIQLPGVYFTDRDAMWQERELFQATMMKLEQ
jgi:hypothetical protein